MYSYATEFKFAYPYNAGNKEDNFKSKLLLRTRILHPCDLNVR